MPNIIVISTKIHIIRESRISISTVFELREIPLQYLKPLNPLFIIGTRHILGVTTVILRIFVLWKRNDNER